MRLRGGRTFEADLLTMSSSVNDYAELCDLGLSQWNSFSYFHTAPPIHTPNLNFSGSVGQNCNDYIIETSSSHENDGHIEGLGALRKPDHSALGIEFSRILGGSTSGNSNDLLVSNLHFPMNKSSNIISDGRSNSYYFSSGTSNKIVEQRPHSPHFNLNNNSESKASSLPYLTSGQGFLSKSLSDNMASASGVSVVGGQPRHTTHGRSSSCKKQPISPEQVLRMFGATQSSAGPTNSYHLGNGIRDCKNRQSPTSSPRSTTHQICREVDRDQSNANSELSTRTITMSRDQQVDHGFGICVKGEKETGRGVYISRIEENSAAERSGLRPGDTILEVNGTPFTSINHEEALKRCVQILKSSREISMTVRAAPNNNSDSPLHVFGSLSRNAKHTVTTPSVLQDQSNLLPYMSVQQKSVPVGSMHAIHQTCSWMDRYGRPASPPTEYNRCYTNNRDRIRRVDLVIEPGQSLGLMIRGGAEYGLGIFVTGVDRDSVADRAGLLIGDEILEVNGNSFHDVSHDEAVSQLKFHKSMSLIIRDVGKVPHSCTSVELEPWSAYSPNLRPTRKGQINVMVEEKALSLLPRHEFASLSYYITEYSAKAMTIDAFVAVLLEMLNTCEKHTLVTEIRELIYPEDRARYDELVYRGEDLYSSEGNRSLQRLSAEPNRFLNEQIHEPNPNVVPDHKGNLHIIVKKTKSILGIAIEGGANTRHPLPRIINIHENGAAYDAGGLEVGQLILEVDGNKVDGLHHQEVARLIAECFGNPEKPDISFLVVEAKKSNLEPKPTALIFLEA